MDIDEFFWWVVFSRSNGGVLAAVSYCNARLCPLQLLEGFLKDNTLSNASMVEHSFVFCSIWAFGSTLGIGDDGIDYRKTFSDW